MIHEYIKIKECTVTYLDWYFINMVDLRYGKPSNISIKSSIFYRHTVFQ